MHNSGSNSGSIVQQIRNEGPAVVMQLAGDIDLHSSIELRQQLLSILADKPPVLVMNLGAVDFMDSSGLATLVEALQLSRKAGGQIRLVSLKQRVKNLLEISRLDTIFKIFPSEAEALA